MGLALHDIRVVEVAQVAAVPMAGRHLADFGAEVIHVEPKSTGDSWRAFEPGKNAINMCTGANGYINYNWENFNRNKKSIGLDISTDLGYHILTRLLSNADIFLTNLRIFERKKYNLEYEILHAQFPKLIYGSLTGYGKEGTETNSPAYDSISWWARSGMGYLFSTPGVPPFIDGGAIGDSAAGFGLALGIMTALFVRERTGIGQEVDLSLLHTGIYQLSYYLSGSFSSKKDYREWGTLSREDTLNPLILPYETQDGRWLLLAMPQSDRYWAKFCQVIGRIDLVGDGRFSSFLVRAENHKVLFQIIKDVFLSKPLSHWKTKLTNVIPYSPYQNFLEVINDPQARINDVFVPSEHPTHGTIEVIDNPIRLSETPATIRTPAPEFGQNTEEVLLENGYSWDDIQKFKNEGVIN